MLFHNKPDDVLHIIYRRRCSRRFIGERKEGEKEGRKERGEGGRERNLFLCASRRISIRGK